MRTDGRKKVKGKIIQLPEGSVTVLKESEPMMVMVKQSQLVERMDPEFWEPCFLIAEGRLCKFGSRRLKELIAPENLIASDHVRNRLGERIGSPPECDVEYYTVGPLMRTGYDLTELQYCNRIAYERLKSTSVREGDILIADSGVAGIGRLCFVSFKPSTLSCTGHLFVLHPEGIDGRFLTVFLHSKYGQSQIHRRKHGVASPYIKSEDLLEILVPVVGPDVQSRISQEHKWVEAMHHNAIEAKSKGNYDDAEYYFQTAEGMLEALIAQVEWLIEGERKTITPLIPNRAPESLQDAFVEQYRCIGERWSELERQQESRILAILTNRYTEIADAIRRLLEQVEEVMAGKRKNVDPVL